jgi:hypothetical protein
MQSFRKIKFEIQRATAYGSYYIIGTYGGKEVKLHTNNSEAFDWWNDDSNKEKHMDAKRYCYNKIRNYFYN